MTPDALKSLRVAVIGAGYAGATAALALSRLGAQVTVYEQAAKVMEVGAGIGLRPSTMDLFRKLGIFDVLDRVTSPSDYFEILTAHGHRIMMEEWPEKDAFNATTHFVHRGDFIDALLGVLPAGMVKLDHCLTGITDNGTTATASFANGVTVQADLIIGADSIRSQVRKHLFSDKPPVFAGEHAYRVVIPMADTFGLVDDGNLRMYMGHGTKIYLLPLRHRKEVSYDVTCLAADSAPKALTTAWSRSPKGWT
jgi:salicylate hydroxylase